MTLPRRVDDLREWLDLASSCAFERRISLMALYSRTSIITATTVVRRGTRKRRLRENEAREDCTSSKRDCRDGSIASLRSARNDERRCGAIPTVVADAGRLRQNDPLPIFSLFSSSSRKNDDAAASTPTKRILPNDVMPGDVMFFLSRLSPHTQTHTTHTEGFFDKRHPKDVSLKRREVTTTPIQVTSGRYGMWSHPSS